MRCDCYMSAKLDDKGRHLGHNSVGRWPKTIYDLRIYSLGREHTSGLACPPAVVRRACMLEPLGAMHASHNSLVINQPSAA